MHLLGQTTMFPVQESILLFQFRFPTWQLQHQELVERRILFLSPQNQDKEDFKISRSYEGNAKDATSGCQHKFDLADLLKLVTFQLFSLITPFVDGMLIL